MKRILHILAIYTLLRIFILSNPLSAAESDGASKPNIVFIAIEDFNPEHLGFYGGRAITPNIDALAKEGVIFTNAYCSSPVCCPSRTSLLTGLRPTTSGVYGNEDKWKEITLPNIPETMPQHFKNNGYEAVKVGKLYHYQMEHTESWSRELPDRVEGRRQLSAWDEDIIPTLKKLDPVEGGGWFTQNLHWGPVDCKPEEFRDGHYVTSAANYFSEPHSKPFFLAIGFHAPHVKFAVPKQFFDLYDVNDIVIPENPPNDLEDIPTIQDKAVVHGVMDSMQWRDIKRAQFACISYTDWCIGQVLDALKKNDLDKNTAVVVWTDHGFLLGEHFQWSKGENKLYNETTKTAFIWKVPGVTPKGEVSNGVVEIIDTFPTFFDLCDIPIPEFVDGESFAPLLKNPCMHWKKAAVTWGTRKRFSVQTERFRLNADIDLNPDTFELYDHNYDPREHINLSCNPQYTEVIDSLITFYQGHEKKNFLLK